MPVLLWRFPKAMRAVASAPHGGGLGSRRWVVNAQVPPSYGRRDPDHHLAKLAVSLGLPGKGVGLMTAADVRAYWSGMDGGVEVVAVCSAPRHATAAPTMPIGAVIRNCLRVFMDPPERIIR